MHLNQIQTKIFYRCLSALISFANDSLSISSQQFNEDPSAWDRDELVRICDVLWEDDSIIDRFIDENPYSLSKSDLDIIAGWKNRVSGSFALVEHNSWFSVFAAEHHAFGVVGLSESIIDAYPGELPMLVHTTLLPFENLIVYHADILVFDAEINDMTKVMLDDWHQAALRRGQIITSAKELIAMMPIIKANQSMRERISLRELIGVSPSLSSKSNSGTGASRRPDYDDESELLSFRRGALAGLTGAEREQAIEDYMASDSTQWEGYDDDIYDIFDEFDGDTIDDLTNAFSPITFLRFFAEKDTPRRTLSDITMALTRAEMLEYAKGIGLRRYSSLKKVDLAKLIVKTLTEDAVEIMQTFLIHSASPAEAELFKQVIEAGGLLKRAFEDTDIDPTRTFFDSVVLPKPPILSLYQDDHALYYVVPDEFVKVFSKIDLEYIGKSVQRIDFIRRSINYFTDVYGMVLSEDLIEWIFENIPIRTDGVEIRHMLLGEIFDRNAEFDDSRASVYFDFKNNEVYLTHRTLSERYAEDERGEVDEIALENIEAFRQTILERHAQIERKPVDLDSLLTTTAIDQYLQLPQAIFVRDLLDANVPDDEDEYLFADEFLESFYLLTKWDPSIEGIVRFFDEWGIPLEVFESIGMFRAVIDFINHSPLWVNNGWSPAELMQQGYSADVSNILQRMYDATPGMCGDGVYFDTVTNAVPKVGRNEPCPCGSGKKYKNCHGRPIV
ncbi:MAG: SEC-C metal-binding domain-containing protein [Coriobacteriia bacterium]|nr:SEC-C metal-binding domain-containing protein [Coriobacteriia bacterium]